MGKKSGIRETDEKRVGCGILAKKGRECGIRTPPSRPSLCLLRRTDERPKGRNSCLRLRPRSVLVLSVSCWCLTKLIFTQKISFAEFSVATCRLKHPVRSHLSTSPLGNLYSRDTSIQETQNLFSYSLYLLPLLKGDLNSAERDTFWIPKPGFNRHSGDTLVLKTWLTTKKADRFSVH